MNQSNLSEKNHNKKKQENNQQTNKKYNNNNNNSLINELIEIINKKPVSRNYSIELNELNEASPVPVEIRSIHSIQHWNNQLNWFHISPSPPLLPAALPPGPSHSFPRPIKCIPADSWIESISPSSLQPSPTQKFHLTFNPPLSFWAAASATSHTSKHQHQCVIQLEFIWLIRLLSSL